LDIPNLIGTSPGVCTSVRQRVKCRYFLGAVRQLPQAIADQAAVGVRDPRAGAPRPIDAQEGLHGRLGGIEPNLGLPVVVEASEGVQEQQRLVRRPPAAAGELTDAVEPGEQGLAVERYRGRSPVEAWVRHRAQIERLRTRRKGHSPGRNHSKRLEIGVPAHLPIPASQWLNWRHLRFASVRAYIAAMDLKFWQNAFREAERELDAAIMRTALDAAAKKLMRARPS
jgi:hypothetical protein